jgi:hypothetical protein
MTTDRGSCENALWRHWKPAIFVPSAAWISSNVGSQEILSTASPDHQGVSNTSQENNQYSNDISASRDEDYSSLDEVFSFVVARAGVHFERE